MVKAVLIGSGNVAQHLALAFLNSDQTELVQVYARHSQSWDAIAQKVPVVNDLALLVAADVYVMAVSDDAIATLSQQLPFQDRLVVHTSGSVPIEAISNQNRSGVFYPLQTFSKNKTVDFSLIPLCLEAQQPQDLALLETLAHSLSGQVHQIDSGQRRALHVAAVFASNFTNHLYQIASEICTDNQMPFDILKPLIGETANKIQTLDPALAQTGPARRHDQQTIHAHLAFLTNAKRRELYQLLTQSIQDEQKL